MSKVIEKIKLHNFKRFRNFEVELDSKLNVFIGENEAGKSSILSAVNLVLNGNRSQFEKLGVERLLNSQAINDFLASEKKYNDLPTMYVELWLNEQNNYELNGKNNSEEIKYDGLRMECAPIDDLSSIIKEILKDDDSSFPFEYYAVKFSTFQGDQYTGYKKYLKHIFIDTALIGNDYAIREYVNDMYTTHVEGAEKNKHQHEYRRAKEIFTNDILSGLNSNIEKYSFSIKNDTKTNLLTDLTLVEEGIGIDNKGKGKQCFIKTEFALNRAESSQNKIDIALIEEPENHLSHVTMKKLIVMINESNDKQLLIATHNNLISARLDLRKTILLHSNSQSPTLFKDLQKNTAEFFIKAPDHGILNFVLSNKVILVEGDAEYMLMEKFYKTIYGTSLEKSNISIISVGGLTFKRYLEIALLLNMKVAVIRDNDENYTENCIESYSKYSNKHIRIFGDKDNDRYTFEVCVYKDNTDLCNQLFTTPRRTLEIQDYMLKNKTEVAFKLLEDTSKIITPQYIKDAMEWIRD